MLSITARFTVSFSDFRLAMPYQVLASHRTVFWKTAKERKKLQRCSISKHKNEGKICCFVRVSKICAAVSPGRAAQRTTGEPYGNKAPVPVQRGHVQALLLGRNPRSRVLGPLTAFECKSAEMASAQMRALSLATPPAAVASTLASEWAAAQARAYPVIFVPPLPSASSSKG